MKLWAILLRSLSLLATAFIFVKVLSLDPLSLPDVDIRYLILSGVILGAIMSPVEVAFSLYDDLVSYFTKKELA